MSIAMRIIAASDVNWKEAPRCPFCGVGVTASGRNMPVARDAARTVYCRDHGETAEPGYAAKLADYHAWRQRRADAIAALEQDAHEHEQERKTGSDVAQ
jgi:hypothetical protein